MTQQSHDGGNQHSRRRGRDKFHSGFWKTAVRQVDEAISLLAESRDPDVRELVMAMLQRLSQTARTLQIKGLAQVIDSAADAVQNGAGADALMDVAHALRGDARPTLFPPIAIVADEIEVERLNHERKRISEPILVCSSLEEVRSRAPYQRPQAMVVPANQVGALDTQDQLAFGYGDRHDLRARSLTAQAGASGYLHRPLSLHSVVNPVRVAVYLGLLPAPRVVVAASEGGVSGDLVEALRDARLNRHRLEVHRVREPDELFYSLERHNPDLVVVGRMGRYRAGHLIHLLGLSERYRSVPMVAMVDRDTISPVQLGAADLMRFDTHGAVAARLVVARLQQARSTCPVRDPITGVLTRPALLSALDREFARSIHTKMPLTLALLRVHGLARVASRWDRAEADRSLRALLGLVVSRKRTEDLLGHLGENNFLLALTDSKSGSAHRRLLAISHVFSQAGRSDRCLGQLSFTAGVADTAEQREGALLRAEAALQRSQPDSSRSVVVW